MKSAQDLKLKTVVEAKREAEYKLWKATEAARKAPIIKAKKALFRAAKEGHTGSIEGLLDKIPDISILDKDGNTPAMQAAKYGHLETLKFLTVRGAQLHITNKAGFNILDIAALNNQVKIVNYLLSHFLASILKDKNKYSNAMLTAAKHSKTNMVIHLLIAGQAYYRVSDKDKEDGNTVLHIAVITGNHELLRKILEEFQPNVNMQNKSGDTALHIAINKKNILAGFLLFHANASTTIRNAKKQSTQELSKILNDGIITSLCELVDFSKSKQVKENAEVNQKILKIIDVLYGCDEFLNDKKISEFLKSFIQKTVGDNKFFQEHIKNGELKLDLLAAAQVGDNEKITTLVASGAKVTWKDILGRTALYHAGKAGKTSTVEHLMSLGANIAEPDANGANILHLSAYNGNTNLLRYALLNWHQHIDIFVKEVDGYTVLHFAAFGGQQETVTFLLNIAHEKIDEKTTCGKSPVFLAARGNHPGTVRYLLQQGAKLALIALDETIASKKITDAAALLFTLATNGADKRTEETLAILQDGLNARQEIDGNTALHLSILKDNKYLALCLVRRGANIEIQNYQSKNPFQINSNSLYFQALEFIATYEAPFAKDEKVVKESHVKLLTMMQILNNDPEVHNNPLLKTETDKLLAPIGDIIPVLFAQYKLSKSIVNQDNKQLNEALLNAARDGDTKTITELFLSGAYLHSRDVNFMTPLLLAAANGHINAMELLLSYSAELNAKDRFGNNILLVAALHNQPLVIDHCLNQYKDIFTLVTTNTEGETVLLVAVSCGHTALVEKLLKLHTQEKIFAEAIVNLKKQNALLVATKCRQNHLATNFLSSNWDINTQDFDGNTALHLAILSNNDLMATTLILREANVASINKFKETPKVLAGKFNRKFLCALIDLKDLSKNNQNQNPGSFSKKMITTLVTNLYSNLLLLKEKELSEAIYKLITANLKNKDTIDHFNALELLEKYKANAHQKSDTKETRENIFLAMNNLYNDDDVLNDIALKNEVDKYLSESNTFLFEEYLKLNNCLLNAIRNGSDIKIIEELLKQGAYIGFTSSTFETPFYLAYHHGWIHLAEFIFNNKPKIAEYHKENIMLKMTYKQGFPFLKAQMEISARAKSIGNKAANLYQLAVLSKNLTLKLFPSFKIKVPELLPIEHKEIYEHLLNHFREFSKLWGEFVTEQQGKDGEITSKAEVILGIIGNRIANLFKTNSLPSKIIDDYIDRLRQQNKDHEETMLMVRSTGKEDTLWLANPGGNESISAVPLEKKAISEAIGKVIASYFSIKSLKQRLLNKKENITESPFLPVFIQAMIGEPINGVQNSTLNPNLIPRSGVMYTGKAGCRIQTAPGHGELIVNSKGAFDTYYVTRENVVHAQISPNKQIRLIPFQDKQKRILKSERNSRLLKESPSISTHTAVAIAEIGRSIEAHYGIPMDVEFVYEPQTNTFNLVQARPIPNEELSIVQPSSVPPNKLHQVKAHAMTVGVISSAGNAARVITQKSELLICHTIEIALKFYLEQKNSPVKAVIIEVEAPETSHEAAQFNSKGIPVVQSSMNKTIEEWGNTTKPVIIIDPQRKQIINWTNHIKVHTNSVKELFDPTNGILKNGYFESSMKPQETLLYVFDARTVDFKKLCPYKPEALIDSKVEHDHVKVGELLVNTNSSDETVRVRAFDRLLTSMYQLMPNAVWTKTADEKSYTALFTHLDTLKKGFDSNGNIKEQMEALNKILVIFCRMAKSKAGTKLGSVHQKLFLHGLIVGLELSKFLNKLQTLATTATGVTSTDRYSEYYEILSRLEALIKDPGSEQSFSSSVYQIVRDRKQLKDALKIPGSNTLPTDKMDTFLALQSFKKLTLNKQFSDIWAKFALEICRNAQQAQMLAHLVKFALKNGIAGDWVNLTIYNNFVLFTDTTGKEISSAKSILAKITTELKQTAKELETLKLSEIHKTFAIWSDKIPDWSNPTKFDVLFKSYTLEIIPLIDALAWNQNLQPLTRKAIIKAVHDLCELMDRTIKSLKGSPEYKDTKLQVERFYKLLQPFLMLCKKWHQYIPDQTFANWYRQLDKDQWYSRKDVMINEIDATFRNLSKDLSERQLNASNAFSVQSAKVGSGASFFRQFSEKKSQLTLEDLFALFHQNILVCTIFLGQESTVSLKHYPEELQSVIKSFSDIQSHLGQIELMSTSYQHPKILIEYSLGLRNHSAKFAIEYDRNTRRCILHINYFGENWYSRMNHIEQVADLEGRFLDATQKKLPHYNAVSRSLEFSWEFSIGHIQQIPAKITNMLNRYTRIANMVDYSNYYYDINSHYHELFRQYEIEDWFTFYSRISQAEFDTIARIFTNNLREYFYEKLSNYAKINNIINIKQQLAKLPDYYFKQMPAHIGFIKERNWSNDYLPISEPLVNYLLDRGMSFGNDFERLARSFPALIKRYNEQQSLSLTASRAAAAPRPN